MSRFAARPIKIEEGVTVETSSNKVKVCCGTNCLEMSLAPKLTVEVIDGNVIVKRTESTNEAKALHGLTARLITNMINGVKNNFTRELEFTGTGYRAAVDGNELILNMGYSHEVRLEIPENLKVSAAKNTIVVAGIEKDKVGQFAAKIRSVRGPEVYKGKGIRYKGEYIRRKAGKTAASK